jgi:hypothetical protein
MGYLEDPLRFEPLKMQRADAVLLQFSGVMSSRWRARWATGAGSQVGEGDELSRGLAMKVLACEAPPLRASHTLPKDKKHVPKVHVLHAGMLSSG